MAPTPPQITYYVVIPPQPPDVGSSLRPIARLVQDEEESVRQKLLTKTFAVLSRFAKKPNAEGLKSQLFALGINSFIVSDQDVRGHLFLWVASANRGAGGIAFRDFSDKPLYCPWEDIAGVTLLAVTTDGGQPAILIDLLRRSTNITPRLDASLFDFPALLQRPGAGLEQFLQELELRAKVMVNRRFQQHNDQALLIESSFASAPSGVQPPIALLPAPYFGRDLRAADLFSFLLSKSPL